MSSLGRRRSHVIAASTHRPRWLLSTERWRTCGMAPPTFGRGTGLSRGQPYRKGRALADDAVNADVTAHRARQLAADGQPQPHPLLLSSVDLAIHLHERLEDLRQE